MSEELTAYCMKCKTKQPLSEAKAVFTRSAQPATEGVCPECGTRLYRMGETEAHAGLMPPEPVRKTAKAGKGAKKAKSTGKSNGSPPRRRGNLVIVESPAKVRTIENYLGKEYKVRASIGHVRDLLKSRLSVDIENNFEPYYRVPNDKRSVVKEIKEAAARAKEVWLATDPDREGEAIAWHLIHAAEIDQDRVRRVVFNEITKDAVQDAFKTPRKIDENLVDAQQARRILDRLVGYELSPLLWRKVRPRLSAGRVQSVAVRMVVEREREIEDFIPVEYWTIDADLAKVSERAGKTRQNFLARLIRINGEEAVLSSAEEVEPVLRDLESAEYVVSKVKKSQRKRNPSAPFTTSTMQQEASRRLNFTARRTMQVAQQLYEGMDIGNGGEVGLITYMRTDSTHISKQAQNEAAGYIAEVYGQNYLPKTPNSYGKKKSKGAQEAHEAIRPTSIHRTPQAMEPYLNRNQVKLYKLIWQRFVASQMAAAIYDTISIDVLAGPQGAAKKERPYKFRASGSTLRFPGFLAVYEDFTDEDNPAEDDIGKLFPELAEQELLDLLRLIHEQHFTQPPTRYSEATLVRALEEHGIGRPSTYAPILNTVQQRGYVQREGKRLFPTETGIVVNDLLVEYFPEIVDVTFTAKMEEELDLIAVGERKWASVLGAFYYPFKEELEHAHKAAENVDLGTENVGRECPKCGKDLIIRWGRYGKFIGCSDFPTCRFTEPWLEKLGIECPSCHKGELVERKSRKGRTFYGCDRYPECEWTSWKQPLPEPCPVCKGLMIVQGKEWAQCQSCEERVQIEHLQAQTHRE